jgi:D-arabinose 1-dehydrogenase-like Zn-dependent alcohol dehydrogenase
MVLKKIRTVHVWTERRDRQPGPARSVSMSPALVSAAHLHVINREHPNPRVPITTGRDILGRIDALGVG